MNQLSEMGRRSRILIVDDESMILNVLSKQLMSLGYECETETSGLSAVQRIKRIRYDLMLIDINMPHMKGTELLMYAKRIDHNLPVVMISGVESIELVRKTLREGAFDYLMKPLFLDELELAAKRAIKHGRMTRQIENYHRELEREVGNRTKELADALERIEATYDETILALGSALETRDVETNEHGLRVALFSQALARVLGISDPVQLTNIERGAYLHDIGKIGVPDAILRKPGDLTDDEWAVMKLHPDIGRDIIQSIEFLSGSQTIVYSHHEKFDGSGYPNCLTGRDIPLEGRIFAVADALDAIVSDRPYRKAQPIATAKEIITESSGKHFDPDVVDALEKLSDLELAASTEHADRQYPSSVASVMSK